MKQFELVKQELEAKFGEKVAIELVKDVKVKHEETQSVYLFRFGSLQVLAVATETKIEVTKKFIETKINEINGGTQRLFFFPNGYGASLVNHSFSYGDEMAILEGTENDFNLTYETKITDDVLPYLDDEGIIENLLKVAKL